MMALHRFKAQNQANTVWALATMGHVDAAFVGALLHVATPQLLGFRPQELASIVWALGMMAHLDVAFMVALVEAAGPQLSILSPQDLANTASALAKLGHSNAAFMGALLEVATPLMCSFTPKDLANLAWALAALDEHNVTFTAALISRAGTQPDVFGEICKLPGCSSAISEHPTDDGMSTIDIAMQLPGNRHLAVEVDGPAHFLSNAPTVLNGATRLRNRLLEARDWQVVIVLVTHWQKLVAKGKRTTRDYLMGRLGVRG
ncbi:hypothetical protein FOA52_009918 [Chlamydomonas sp. UWO 241]|nr:hypothetical protein FOA52_009918 [Chlamydomonas sp. UWO 241]